MTTSQRPCARCARENPLSSRFCSGCGLPLGSALPDAEAGAAALGAYEAPDATDPDLPRLMRQFVESAELETVPAGHGWRLVVPLGLDRRQAVYLGQSGTDPDGRAILGLVSVCGPATERDAPILLKMNARTVEGHFAIKTLLGEDYFVVIHNVTAAAAAQLDAPHLVRRIAEVADGLEERLSQGRDLY